MTEERIITATTIITGEKNDGKELKVLLEKSVDAGMYVCKGGGFCIVDGGKLYGTSNRIITIRVVRLQV